MNHKYETIDKYLTYLLVFCALVFPIYVLLFFSAESWYQLIGISDGVAYQRIAYNIAHGKGPTFDLLTRTNGFHPLWLLIQIPLFISSESIIARFLVLKILYITTVISAGIVWYRVFIKLTNDIVAAGFFLLLFTSFGWSIFVLYSGLETALIMLTTGFFYFYSIKLYETKEKATIQFFYYGLLFGICVLARLDSFFLTLPVAGWMIFQKIRNRDWSHGIVFFAGSLGLILIYLAINFAYMDSILPVSGMVKRATHPGFPAALSNLQNWVRNMKSIGLALNLVWIGMIVLIIGIAVYLFILYNYSKILTIVCVSLLAGSISQYAFYIFFMREINTPWHLYPQALTFYILTSTTIPVFRKFGKAIKKPILHLLLLFVLIILASFSTHYYNRLKSNRRVEKTGQLIAAKWIQKNLHTTDRIAMYDSWVIAWLNPAISVVDLTGYVTNKKTSEFLKTASYSPVFHSLCINYFIAHAKSLDPPKQVSGCKLHKNIKYDGSAIRDSFIISRCEFCK